MCSTINNMKKICIFLIRCYQVLPLSSHSMCRFTPTCSQYMAEAIEAFGVVKGTKLGLKRLKKCRPNGPFGYDPIPKKEDL